LLKEQAQALVNTVNCVGVMGKGIAKQFKEAYPEK
jgi:O-acetyl-ADP-ribose deacetylase (regulator of RNase III)